VGGGGGGAGKKSNIRGEGREKENLTYSGCNEHGSKSRKEEEGQVQPSAKEKVRREGDENPVRTGKSRMVGQGGVWGSESANCGIDQGKKNAQKMLKWSGKYSWGEIKVGNQKQLPRMG